MRMTLLALVGTSLIACRGGGNGPGDEAQPDSLLPVAQVVSVQDIQNDALPVRTPVTLEGVVVLAIDSFGARTGDMWVGEPEGGAFSGIKVFGAPLDQIATLQPGDIVTIANAEKDEFACTEQICGRAFDRDNSITEIKGAGDRGVLSVLKTGNGPLPPAVEIDAKAIDALPIEAQEAEWEKYEGVRVKILNARQLSFESAFGDQADDQHAFKATGGIEVQSLISSLDAAANLDTCYEAMTGIVDYFFSFKLLPADPADLVGAGAGCNASTLTTATAATVQRGEATGTVLLRNVVVTARDDLGSKGIYVADVGQAAEHNTVLVFGTFPPEMVVGSTVMMLGTIKEFDTGETPAGDTLTELTSTSGILVDASPIEVRPVTVTVDQVNDIATGEPFESVLVKATTLRVSNPAAGGGKIELVDNDGRKLFADDDIFKLEPAPAKNACLDVVGVMSVQLFDNIRTINPRSAADVTTGTGCAAPPAPTVTTIAAVQAGTVTGDVILNDVFVVALTDNKKNLWVSSSLTAAANGGIFVFRGTGNSTPVLPANIVPGAKVSIAGATKEQNDNTPGETLTQIERPTVTFVEAPTTAPVPVVDADAALLVVAETGEPFESVLVTMKNVSVVTAGTQQNFGVGSLRQGTTTFLSDDDIVRLPETDVGKCYTLTGIWTFQVFQNVYGLLPISKVEEGTCN
jgi:hypothetical protein